LPPSLRARCLQPVGQTGLELAQCLLVRHQSNA
jgi:hypothetical protein